MPQRRKISLFRLYGEAAPTDGLLSAPAGRRLGRRVERVNLSPAGASRPGIDLRAADEAIALPVERGFELIGLLGGLPYELESRLAEPADGAIFNPLADLDAYEMYVEHVAAHFRGQIDTWESWHEPNLAASWGALPSPKDYVAVLRAQRRALTKVNPDAKLLLAATHDADLAFIREVLGELAGEQAFDAVAIHPYRWSNIGTFETRELPLEDALSTAQMTWKDELHAIARLFHLYRYGTPEMIITECGWGRRDEELRAQSMLSIGRRSHREEVARDADHIEQSFELLREDPSLDFVKTALWFDLDASHDELAPKVPKPSKRFRPRSTLARGRSKQLDLADSQTTTPTHRQPA